MKHCLLIIFLFIAFAGQAQNEFVRVDTIMIEGNKKTKKRVIFRELDFKLGDTIETENLMNRLKTNEFLLMNTDLFTQAKINIIDWKDGGVRLNVELVETWYILPVPIFELADRNFNVWWQDHNHSFKRINYGIRFYYQNISGNKDILKVAVQLGYTQKLELDYDLPLFNEKQTVGGNFNVLLARNREVSYQTIENKQQFDFSPDKRMLKRFRAGFGVYFRPGLRVNHEWQLRYYRNAITDSVAILNPNFFLEGKTKQRYFELNYTCKWDNRDIKPYPLSGHYSEAFVQKEGLGLFNDINSLSLTLSHGQYFSFNRKFSLELFAQGRYAFIQNKQPYYNIRALGYEGNFVRGYEYYVIDGMDYGYLKSGFRFELINRELNLGKLMPIKSFALLPLKVYLKLNNEVGYVAENYYNETNPLNNEVLWGGGVGIDFVIYYNNVIQLEYSVNRQKEHGFFLHYKLGFQ